MPVKIPDSLPAIELLKKENIFVMSQLRADMQDIRPLKVLILNLMPIKITTETDLIRLLSNSPLQIEVDFLKLESHTSKNTPIEHLMEFYHDFETIKRQNYDGMIITGAPVEMMSFEDVNYWEEITEVFDWARKHVTSTFYICWAAQAAMYHFYGVEKSLRDKKVFGIYKHTVNDKTFPLFRGFDDEFFAPHSRHTEVKKEDVLKHPELKILSESDEAGVYIVSSRGGREFYVTGHSEYAPTTLHNEYIRDLEKGMDIDAPENYYENNDPSKSPIVKWSAHGTLLFNNWMNYFLYQETPFDISKITEMRDIEQIRK